MFSFQQLIGINTLKKHSSNCGRFKHTSSKITSYYVLMKVGY